MIRLNSIRFNNADDGYTTAAAAHVRYEHGYDVVIARIDRDGKLLGGVIFQSFTGASIKMHVASLSPNWLSRDYLWVCFHYAFMQLGCRQIIAEIRSSNHKCLAESTKLGFIDVAIVPKVYLNDDLVLRSLVRDECKWLALKPRSWREGGNGQ